MEAFTVKVSAGSSRTRLRASWGGGRERDCRDKQTRTEADGVPRSCGRTVSESGDFDRFVRFQCTDLASQTKFKAGIKPQTTCSAPLAAPAESAYVTLSLPSRRRTERIMTELRRRGGGDPDSTDNISDRVRRAWGVEGWAGVRPPPGKKKAAVQVVVSRRTRPTWSSG